LNINLKAENLLTLTSRWLLRKFGIEIFFLLSYASVVEPIKVFKTKEIVNQLKEMKISYLDEHKMLTTDNVVKELALKGKVPDKEYSKVEKNKIYMPVVYRLREGNLIGIYEIAQLYNKQGYRLSPFGLKVFEAINVTFKTPRQEIEFFTHFCREELKNFRYL